MIPAEVAEIMDILTDEFGLEEDQALKIAYRLYDEGYRIEVTE